MKKIIFLLTLAFSLSVFSADLMAQTTVKRKVNRSHKGKSAAIGAGVGAVTGAVISKNKTKGALIGAGAGAAGGYLYGRHRAKKHPKTVYKTKTTVQ